MDIIRSLRSATWRAAVFLAGVTACASACATTATPGNAEYAIRWNATAGGPATGEATLAALGLRATATTHFTVVYYDLPAGTTAPPGFTTIVRRRVVEGVGAELTWKLRGDVPLATWKCALSDGRHAKAEVDVGLGAANAVTRRYSYSCASIDAARAAAQLAASPRGCTAAVTRWESGELKVEAWRMPDGTQLLEVSSRGNDTPRALAKFREKVAAPLLVAGVAPAQDSKTELGGRCP